MAGGTDAGSVAKVSLARFSFFMKAIAENDLWDEAHEHLESLGHHELLISREPITAVQDLIKKKIKEGHTLNHRAKRVSESVPGRPPEPPHPPEPDPGGQGPGGKPPGPPVPQ